MKRTKDNNILKNNNNGITLISLIFTIIVIMLIAAINISILFGDNGVITEAVQASEKQKETDMLDDIGFTWSALEIKYLSQGSNQSKQDYIKNNLKDSLSSKGVVDEASIKTTAAGGTIFKFESNTNNKIYNILRDSTGYFSIIEKYDKLSSIITSENYGDYVKYSAGGVNSWRIFYNDSNNIFIITSDHLHKDSFPEIDSSVTPKPYNIIDTQPYNITFNASEPNATDIDILKSDTAKKYMYSFTTEYETPNLKIISFLLNPSTWEKFTIPNISDHAIGTPTIEMFQASWNSKYPNKIFSFYVPDNEPYIYGYAFPLGYAPLDGTRDEEEKLYLPHYGTTIPDIPSDPDVPTDSLGYWLASPNCAPYSGKYTQLLYIHSRDLKIWGGDPIVNPQQSIRPVVCLNSDVYGLKTESGWELIK